MKIISFKCKCGTTNPEDALYYDGCLGYEAIICKKCGRYGDHSKEYEADDWSRSMISDEQDYQQTLKQDL